MCGAMWHIHSITLFIYTYKYRYRCDMWDLIFRVVCLPGWHTKSASSQQSHGIRHCPEATLCTLFPSTILSTIHAIIIIYYVMIWNICIVRDAKRIFHLHFATISISVLSCFSLSLFALPKHHNMDEYLIFGHPACACVCFGHKHFRYSSAFIEWM